MLGLQEAVLVLQLVQQLQELACPLVWMPLVWLLSWWPVETQVVAARQQVTPLLAWLMLHQLLGSLMAHQLVPLSQLQACRCCAAGTAGLAHAFAGRWSHRLLVRPLCWMGLQLAAEV